MKNLITFLLLMGVCCAAEAQKADTLPYIRPMVIKQFLDIPAAYTLVSYEFAVSNKSEIFKTKNYGSELNARAKDLLDRALPGTAIYIDDVVVLKDGKQIKWKGKSFVVQ